jgi:hypothetical protein
MQLRVSERVQQLAEEIQALGFLVHRGLAGGLGSVRSSNRRVSAFNGCCCVGCPFRSARLCMLIVMGFCGLLLGGRAVALGVFCMPIAGNGIFGHRSDFFDLLLPLL